MQHATSVNVILCILILSCGVIIADALYSTERWSILDSIADEGLITLERSLSSLDSLRPNSRPSCADPTPEDVPSCRTLERQILSSTVRIEIEAWISRPAGPKGSGLSEVRPTHGSGHGTVRDGRYLITHNHFDVPLPASGAASSITFGTVTFYAASGERLALQAQPASLSVVRGGEETLLLDFGLVGDMGFFEAAGLASADFKNWQTLPLQSGMEVAQVNWDGRTTHVQWVTIEAVLIGDDTPRLVLSNGVTRGASGGGVFWNGYHVANNWALVETVASDGGVRRQKSIAALSQSPIPPP